MHAGGQEFEPPRLHQNLRNRVASEPKSKRAARTACLDFGFFAGLNKIHLDEAKRLSLERLVRWAAARPFKVCRLSRDAYQLEVEKCVCAAARPSRCGRATRVVATTGKIRRTFTNHVAKCSRASSPPSFAVVSQRPRVAGLNSVASVVWSSEQAHSVDALAAEGDEGR